MAKSKRKSSGSRSSKSTRSRGASGRANGRSTRQDAIALLKADHRQVEEWFEEFEKSRSSQKKADLAEKICLALKVHTTIEEEIFYPAFLEATSDKDMHHEAEVEHDGAKKLIAEIEAGGEEDDYFESRVHVLSEMIKHHVKEEEGRDGMFAEARKADMDLEALGEALAARKEELMGDMGAAPRGGNGRRKPVAASSQASMN